MWHLTDKMVEEGVPKQDCKYLKKKKSNVLKPKISQWPSGEPQSLLNSTSRFDCSPSSSTQMCARQLDTDMGLPQGVTNIRIFEYIWIFSETNICSHHIRIMYWYEYIWIFVCIYIFWYKYPPKCVLGSLPLTGGYPCVSTWKWWWWWIGEWWPGGKRWDFSQRGGSAKCYAMVLWCPIIQGSDQCAQIVIDIFVFGNKSCLF